MKPLHTRVTVLCDNRVERPGLLGEHGLSLWVEWGEHAILFDTGQGLALAHNAKVLEIPLDPAGAIVLSHGHYDHTGGLGIALDAIPAATVYAHPDAFLPRFSQKPDGTIRAIGLPVDGEGRRRGITSRCRLSREPATIAPGAWLTGEIPRRSAAEADAQGFYTDEMCTCEDALADDQALVLEQSDGDVVIVGCAHAGIINTLQYIRQRRERPVRAVIGGLHLASASPNRIAATADALQSMDVGCVVPLHCTGLEGVMALRRSLGSRVRCLSVGDVLRCDCC